MPISGERTVIGPKTLQLSAPQASAFGTHLTGSQSLTVNTGPRAGQAWEVLSASYLFPGAKRNNVGLFIGKQLIFNWSIGMTANGVLVAEQQFTESEPAVAEGEEKEIPLHFLGSLEPFSPAVVFPGSSLEFFYSVSKNFTGITAISTGGEPPVPGEIVVSYNLIRYARGRSR